MTTYPHESHLRSILKGISWRIIATLDTILIVLVITCIQGECSIEPAIKIGLIEFLVKLFVYYIHERIWQFTLKDGVVTAKESFFKSASWRLVATSMTFVISGTVLKDFGTVALSIAITEMFTKFALYYLHERLWLKIPIGRVRKIIKRKEHHE